MTIYDTCDCDCAACDDCGYAEITCEFGTCEYTGEDLYTLPFVSHQAGQRADCVQLNMCDQCYDMVVSNGAPTTYCQLCHPVSGCSECPMVLDGKMCYQLRPSAERKMLNLRVSDWRWAGRPKQGPEIAIARRALDDYIRTLSPQGNRMSENDDWHIITEYKAQLDA